MMIELNDKKNTMGNAEDIYSVLQALLEAEDPVDQDKEHFWVFQLDTRHRIKTLELVTLGTLTGCLVHPREVFTRAIANRCCDIVVAHNHPSGVVTPSQEDLLITKQLVQAGQVLEIPVLDHLIVAKESYLSFKQQGLM